jgi:hypothetical protein
LPANQCNRSNFRQLKVFKALKVLKDQFFDQTPHQIISKGLAIHLPRLLQYTRKAIVWQHFTAAAQFGRRCSGETQSPFPQLHRVYLAKVGTHAIVDAMVAPCTTSEQYLANLQ